MKRWIPLALVLLAAAALSAQEKFRKRELKERVDISGTIVCIGCTLAAQDGGADPQCTLHARHAQGLLAPDGTLWTFVDNARGHHLVTHEKLRGQEVKVLGWKFPKAQYIEVWKYSLKAGDAWESWDWCKTCGFEKGDNQDKDVCADCAGE